MEQSIQQVTMETDPKSFVVMIDTFFSVYMDKADIQCCVLITAQDDHFERRSLAIDTV